MTVSISTTTPAAIDANLADGTLVTNADPRSRMHKVVSGATQCATPASQLATSADLENRKMCFFCDNGPAAVIATDAPLVEATVTIRIAEALISHLGQNVVGFATPAESAEIRRAGRGSTYLVTAPVTVANDVADFISARLDAPRTGLPVERYRAVRALRMIEDDIAAGLAQIITG